MHWSLPLRECGLKSTAQYPESFGEFVTPLAGVWVEIYLLWHL